MSKYLALLAVVLFIPGWAKAIVISGKAVAYTGNTLVVWTEDDYISHKRIPLAQSKIDRDGSFRVEFDITETRELILAINSVEGILYVEENHDYEVNFPAFIPDKTLKKFDRISVDLAIQGAREDDLNFLIRNFNGALTYFINEHYNDFAVDKYRGSETYKVNNNKNLTETGMLKPPCKDCPGESQRPTEYGLQSFGGTLEEFRVNVEDGMGKYMKNQFFKDYVTYNIAQLELASGQKRQALIEEYFYSQPFRHNNPAFVECFELFYRDVISDAIKGSMRDSMYVFINAWKDYKMLGRHLAQQPDMIADHVRNMTIIVGMRMLKYDRTFLPDGIESILQGMADLEPDQRVAHTAANVLESIRRGQSGWEVEDFTVPNATGGDFSLSEMRGKYVYLFFYAEWCTACLKELQIMEKFQDTYGKEISFVAVSMDDSITELKQHVAQNRDQDWTFVYGSADPLIREKFQLRALPGAYLIDPDGKSIHDHALRPSEGITKDFDKIKSLVSNPPTGTNVPKTWK